MKNKALYGMFALSILCFMVCRTAEQDNPIVSMQTEFGKIVIEVYSKKAPLTAKNFMQYVDEGRFRDAFFYRVVRLDNQPDNDVKIEVIQGGIGFVESDLRLPPIAHETTAQTGVLHIDGVISMARAVPGTASSEFFVCIGDQAALDFGGRRNPDGAGFAAFGRVIDGMDVVCKIHAGKADGQMLKTPVRITEVRRVKKRELRADPL
jgi:peptidyl-prolyl cis-trans isomerase A (cyclophilin A)